MGCEKYRDRIGEFVGSRDVPAHFEACSNCAGMLRRARAIAGAVEDLPRITLPGVEADEIRRLVLYPGVGAVRRLVRVAAVLLILAGGLGLVTALTNGSNYQPLELQVIDVDANGAHDEELAFDHIFGPERTSLVATGGPDRR
jgi:hypothetical protein